MEGLLLAKIVAQVQGLLPFSFSWTFPDETSLVLSGARESLVLLYRLPEPRIFVSQAHFTGEAITPFQRALAARVRGRLIAVQQFKLDRLVALDFAKSEGFIETPPMRLIFELTGRNANLILLQNDKIVVAAREISNKQNRFRQIRAGISYKPPPPYEKLDPRKDDLLFQGLTLLDWHKKVDGLGPTITAIIAQKTNLRLNEPLHGDKLQIALAELRKIINQSEMIEVKPADLKEKKLDQIRQNLKSIWQKRLARLNNQLIDMEKAEKNAEEADNLRKKADILLAYAHQIPDKIEIVQLPDFYDNGEIEIKLDKNLDVIANANNLYAKSKHRLETFSRSIQRKPKILLEKNELERLLDKVDEFDEEKLRSFLEIEEKEEINFAQRYQTSHGFNVFVGRNAKENDFLTHRFAKGHDLWFHVQGYPGSHVILQSEKKEVPFSDILEAAGIAAYHSKVRGSQNIAVDYTFIRFVKRIKGAKNGQVHFSSQKTVFVNADKPITS